MDLFRILQGEAEEEAGEDNQGEEDGLIVKVPPWQWGTLAGGKVLCYK